MLLNHSRQTPADWDDALPSWCPDCRAELLARRGRIVRWHWAHRTHVAGQSRPGCHHKETDWHLRWKMVYHDFAGWRIEVPITAGGRTYRADALHERSGRVREFVHSLSDRYIAKHLTLRSAGMECFWIYDGSVFVASRAREVRRGGLKHLLKPKARWLQSRVGGMVHWQGKLWKEWQHDVWYPVESETCGGMLQRFDALGIDSRPLPVTAARLALAASGPASAAREPGEP